MWDDREDQGEIDEPMESEGMSRYQERALAVIKAAPDGLTQMEIQQLLDQTQKRTSEILNALKRWGSIEDQKEGTTKRWRAKH